MMSVTVRGLPRRLVAALVVVGVGLAFLISGSVAGADTIVRGSLDPFGWRSTGRAVFIADAGDNRVVVDKPNGSGGYSQSVADSTGLSAPPYPPIWVGSGGPRMLRLTARHADVWNASGAAGRELETAVATSLQLDEASAAIGLNRTRSDAQSSSLRAMTPPRSSIACTAITKLASRKSSSC